jgi:hypothetical protein
MRFCAFQYEVEEDVYDDVPTEPKPTKPEPPKKPSPIHTPAPQPVVEQRPIPIITNRPLQRVGFGLALETSSEVRPDIRTALVFLCTSETGGARRGHDTRTSNHPRSSSSPFCNLITPISRSLSFARDCLPALPLAHSVSICLDFLECLNVIPSR